MNFEFRDLSLPCQLLYFMQVLNCGPSASKQHSNAIRKYY